MLISYLLTALVLLSLVPTASAAELEPYIISNTENSLSTCFDWNIEKYPASLTPDTAFNTRVALCQDWGFTYGAVIGSGRSVDRVAGLGGKDATDTSVQVTGNSSSVDIYFENWKGPCRPEFKKDIDLSQFTGNQKWQIWCLERFLNRYDPL